MSKRMSKDMMAYCGTYCSTCDWKEKMNCQGCKAHASEVFWGKCSMASCAMERELNHCGECGELPCEQLKSAYKDPEHGDHGERLTNLRMWAEGKESTLKVRSGEE